MQWSSYSVNLRTFIIYTTVRGGRKAKKRRRKVEGEGKRKGEKKGMREGRSREFKERGRRGNVRRTVLKRKGRGRGQWRGEEGSEVSDCSPRPQVVLKCRIIFPPKSLFCPQITVFRVLFIVQTRYLAYLLYFVKNENV